MEVLFVAIGLGILGYLAFVFFFPKIIPEESGDHTKNVLRNIYESTQATESAADSTNAARVLKEEFSEEPLLVRQFYTLPFMGKFYIVMLQAGHQPMALPMMFMLPGMVILLSGMFLIGGLGPASLLLAILVSYYVPYKHFRRKVKKRNAQFINLFPDVLDMIVRSVRSGFPITTALRMVAENMEPPVSNEFQVVVNEIALGRSVTEALTRLSHRINEPDIHFFVVVLTVQQETGGNLAEVVTNLSGIIRKRKQLRLKIHAMTSEGRATAMILGALPLVVFFALYFLRRDYLEPLWTDPLGMAILGVAIALIISCFFVVNKMIDIDI